MEVKDHCYQSETLFVFCLYKNTDLFAFYDDKVVKSKYDFKDDMARFFYDNFSIYYRTFSTEMSENKFNAFMTQNKSDYSKYVSYGGWGTVKKGMGLSDDSDIKNYFKIIKKYSLIREYGSSGFPIQKIIEHDKFKTMSADQIYKIMRVKTDKINTIINGDQDVSKLGKNASNLIKGFLNNPSLGISFGWESYDSCFRGFRKKKFVVESMLSNEGKTRKLVALAVHMGIIEGVRVFIMTNEMTEEDIEACMVVTIINHPKLKHNFDFTLEKTEDEIVRGLYRDRNGKFIKREFDECGEPILSDDEFERKLLKESDEFNNTLAVMDWIEKNSGNISFKDVSKHYSDDDLELEIRKAVLGHGAEYIMYDTLKGYRTDGWEAVKQTATRFGELMKELDVGGYANYQLTDDSVYLDIFDFNSNNLANSKQVFHVLDSLTGSKRLFADEYDKYKIHTKFGEIPLNASKVYYGVKIMKSRTGGKGQVFAFEVDLDKNTWIEIGHLGLEGKKKVSRTPKDTRR